MGGENPTDCGTKSVKRREFVSGSEWSLVSVIGRFQ